MELLIDDASLEQLGDEICELAAHISAATYRFLRKLSAFDRRGGWKEWGVRSCAHWLNWKCGFDIRSAREKVRVARVLDDLPLICETFSRGEVSYSKVRAITRIATPGTEADLLMFARHGTTQHVEKIVRGYRRNMPVGDAHRIHERRYVESRYDEDGSVVLKARLTPDEGAIVLEALRKVQEEVRKVRRSSQDCEDGSAEPPRDRADALVEMARRELAGGKERSSSGDRYLVTVHVDEAGACHTEEGSALPIETVRRLTCDGSLVAMVENAERDALNVGRKTGTIPAAIRRAPLHRDGGCRYPGCAHRAFVDGHHIRHWSKGGETALSNLVLLCSFHHRLLHEGGVTMSAEADGRFTFRLKDGRVVETAAISVEPGGVERRNIELGLTIDANTPIPQWDGRPCDYSVAIEGLLKRNASAEPLTRSDHDYHETACAPS
jgi:hypothetical protein